VLRSLVIDYNGFFAACEQQERPELRGRPVAVAPLLAETTCCIAASREAKPRGVKVGVPVAEARRLCPGLVVLAARPAIYIKYHHALLTAVESCLPVDEILSIDEVACVLPSDHATPLPARALAVRVKAAVRAHAGECLTCSIGLAPNPWLAKIASDLEKPDGLVVIEQSELPERLYGLELRDLPGVGSQMEARLVAAGLDTVARLSAAPIETLRAAWRGIEGERMWRRLRGELVPLPPRGTSSIGHSHVLPPRLRTVAGARATLHRLLQKAAMRLRAANYYAGSLHLALRYRGGLRWGDVVTFAETQDSLELLRHLDGLWAHRPGAQTEHLGVGVTLGDFTATSARTLPLPGLADAAERRAGLNAALDRLNCQLGKHTVVYGGALGALDYAPVRIAFNRIPDLTLEEGGGEGE
jgi:DNA polymerase IV